MKVRIPELFSKHAVRIDHIAVAVRDLEASLAWCTKLLGLELIERRRTEGAQTAMLSAVLKLGPVTLVLTQGTSSESQVSRYLAHYGPGVTHVAIEVTDVPSVVEELQAAGIQFATEIIRGDGICQAFTRRDEGTGMMFELIERSGGGFSDESVNTLFRTLEESGDF